jgi:acetyltransferase-like isoleucine patch superfamily enzyme
MPDNFYTRDLLSDLVAGGLAEIGEHTYGRPLVLWWGENARLRIGRYCSIADNVVIFLGGNHRVDWVTTYPFSAIRDVWPEAAHIQGHPATRGDVVIGSDVWLGRGCNIMSGVTIGHGAVIGAGAIVTRDVPPYTIVAGNPARNIRTRFSPEIVNRLLASEWWNWPQERIRRAIPHLMSGDVSQLLKVPLQA